VAVVPARAWDCDRRPCTLEIAVQRLQCLQHRRTRDLDVDVKLAAVLQRLEFADQFPELLRSFNSDVRRTLLAQADHFGGHRTAPILSTPSSSAPP